MIIITREDVTNVGREKINPRIFVLIRSDNFNPTVSTVSIGSNFSLLDRVLKINQIADEIIRRNRVQLFNWRDVDELCSIFPSIYRIQSKSLTPMQTLPENRCYCCRIKYINNSQASFNFACSTARSNYFIYLFDKFFFPGSTCTRA